MDKQQKIIVLALGALLLVIAVSLAVTLIVLNTPIYSEFEVPQFEENAVKGVPDSSGLANYGKMTVSEGFEFCMCATPKLNGNTTELFFTALETNKVYIKLRLYDVDGNVLAESGLLKAGEYLPMLTLSAVPKDEIIRAQVFSYEPETYYSVGSAKAELKCIIE